MMNLKGLTKKLIDLVLMLFFISTLAQAQNSFSGVNGAIWNDTNGIPIQAHGGQVQKIGNKWWWVGEDHTKGYRSNGISLYSSDDLHNWKFEGYVMRTITTRDQLDNDPYFVKLYGQLSVAGKDSVFQAINDSTSVVERPKLLYNKTTGKYIIWFHADGPTAISTSNYATAAAGVAIADSITGPYRFIRRSRLDQLPDSLYGTEWYEAVGNRGMARDMNVFVDDDGEAYIIYSSEENRTIFISRLNKEYTGLSVSQTPVGLAKNGVDFIRLFPGATREAPAMFKYNGVYYLITSGATGWSPNAATVWRADSIFGKWEDMGNPCVSAPGIPYSASLTFETQSTDVIPFDPVNGKFIYMGDRWNSSNLADSRYVWLPVYITPAGNIELYSLSNWNLSVFDSINNVRFTSDAFDKIYFSNDDLPVSFKAEVRDSDNWKNTELNISWPTNINELPPASISTITGKFLYEGANKTADTRAVNIPKGLLYFIDCGATSGSDLYDSIQTKRLAPNLVNKNTYDQPFDSASGWGYTGIIGMDINYKNATSKDEFTSGWWAYSNKPIDYKLRVSNDDYRLTVGFQEWWNTGRDMSVSIIYENNLGESVTKVLGTFYNYTESTQDYTFKLSDLSSQNPYITVRIQKTGTPDPVVSWLALTSLSLNTETGLDDLISHQSKSLKVYPNPAFQNQTVYVETDNTQFSPDNNYISIFYLSGQMVDKYKVTGRRTAIGANLSPGIYVVRYNNENTKLIIQ